MLLSQVREMVTFAIDEPCPSMPLTISEWQQNIRENVA